MEKPTPSSKRRMKLPPWIRRSTTCYCWLASITTLLIVGVVAGLLSALIVANRDPVIDLGYSKYQGSSSKGVNSSRSIDKWLGIRYAAPPLGDLRFRAPEPPLTNRNLIAANTHGPICLLTTTGLPAGYSEDCLFLDVYAPAQSGRRKQKYPVYIFIQGGGFNSNGNPNYDGSGLIEASGNNIVVVTFGYRVGLYGFLASKEVQSDGDLNVGNLDQRMVFQWVQKYIEQFGGDPDQVTIGGDSAGGASVDLHLSAYGGRNDDLFHAAAAESQSFGAQFTVAESQYQYDSLVSRARCNGTDSLACLRSLSIDELQAANSVVPTPGGGGGKPLFMYSNVIDGNFTTDYTYNLYAGGKFIKMPVIFGACTNDGTTFVPRSIATQKEMNSFLKNQFPKLNTSQLATIDTLYPQNQTENFNGTGAYWRATSDAYGDMRYMCPGLYVSAAFDKAGVDGNWNYRFNVEDPALIAAGYGVVHTQEIPLIWGPKHVTGQSTIPKSYYTTNADMVGVMQGYWTSFIRTKNPNTFRLKGTPVWERFAANTMDRIVFQEDSTQMENVTLAQRAKCGHLSRLGASLEQ